MNTFEILQYSFMQRAIVAGLVLAALLAWLGTFVIMRKMSFFSDGIAHASLAGIAIGLLASVQPLTVAIVFSIVFALTIYYLERKTTLSSDAIIGMLFTAGMSLGVILISLKSGYQPDLMSFLFGNILAIRPMDIVLIISLSVLISAFLLSNHRQITLVALDPETAYLDGIRVNLLQILFYIILATSVVLGVKILGIILVSALLVIPASTAKLLSRSFRELIIRSIVISEIAMLIGIGLSYYLNVPTGPAIVLVGTIFFFIILFYKQISTGRA
jgi:ABC-type Mn2+/Zn2+ transport system permease subunit